MEELKQCPFCGGSAEICTTFGIGSEARLYKIVSCTMCWAKTSFFEHEDEAVAYWNTRAQIDTQHTHCCPCGAQRTCTIEDGSGYDSLLDEEYWHLSCGHMEVGLKPRFCPECGAKVVE